MHIENRNLLAAIIERASHYRGSDDDFYHGYMDMLLRLEAAIRTRYNVAPGKATDPAKEREFTKLLLEDPNHKGYTLNDLLGKAQNLTDAKRHFVERLLRGEKGETLQADLKDIVIVETDLVYVVPGQAPVMPNNGQGTFQPRDIRPRTTDMIMWLTDPGTRIAEERIQLSDMIYHKGKVSREQMRTAPYTILEILPWKLKIAVCDEVGETTLFLPNEISNADIARHNKTELIEKFGAIDVTMNKMWQAKLYGLIEAHLTQDHFTLETASAMGFRKREARKKLEPITDSIRHELEKEIGRTGQKGKLIIQGMADAEAGEYPTDLNDDTIRGWFKKDASGRYKHGNANPEHILATFRYLKTQSNEFNLNVENRREILLAEVRRTGQKGDDIITGLGKSCPEGLTRNIVKNWISRETSGLYSVQTANPDFYQTVLVYLKSQSTVLNLGEEERRDRLIEHIRRTEKSSHRIVKALGNNCPAGLTFQVINNWLSDSNATKTVKEEFFNIVMEYLINQPDAFNVNYYGRRDLFQAYMKQTGLTAGDIALGLKQEKRLLDICARDIADWTTLKKRGRYNTNIADPKLYFEALDFMMRYAAKSIFQPTFALT